MATWTRWSVIKLLVCSCASVFVCAQTALASTKPVHHAARVVAPIKNSAIKYAGSVVSLNVPRTFQPGETNQVRVAFKNIGNITWKRTGANFVALYHWNNITKLEAASRFARASWETPSRPTKIPVPSVAPGQEVTFAFPVHAPNTPGEYHESFILSAENVAWMGQTAFDLVITVAGTPSSVSLAPAPAVSPTVVSPVTTEVPSSLVTTTSPAWKAELVDKGGIEWQIATGDKSSAEMSFKNTGTNTWNRDTGSFVSLYAVDATGKKGRASSFVTGSDATHSVARLTEASVPPGGIGHFKIIFHGPATAGAYQEAFALAAENTAWIDGGLVTLSMRVPAHDEFIDTALPDDLSMGPTIGSASSSAAHAPSASDLFAVITSRSPGPITGPGYNDVPFVVAFKNVSQRNWNNPSIHFIDLRRPVWASDSSLQDAAWNNSNEAVRLMGTTKPGDQTSLAFSFHLPADQGSYTALFQLYVDGQPVQGGVVEIPLLVSSSASSIVPRRATPTPVTRPISSPVTIINTTPAGPPIDAIPLTGDISTLPNEPMIRVGILKTADDQSTIQAMNTTVLVQQNGTTVCTLNPAEQTTVRYDRTNHVYTLTGACTGQSTSYYIFRASDNLSPMRVTDYARNDNTFRAEMELRYTPLTDSVWLINELPIEWYLKGIAETSNVSPPEFQRTLLTAARTYAMYHVQHATKHADEYYLVDAHYDQVYRGYGSEARTPTISAAVDATRGQIVTYQGRLAITPYFSTSDGRTRGWGEVWAGASSYPWLVSVPVPEDQGRVLSGHGVGMSASGALAMANEGKHYDDILKYFYTGIELRRAYK